MLGSHPSIVFFMAAALGCAFAPAGASAAPRSPNARAGRVAPSTACVKSPVEIVAGSEAATFSLARCDGKALPSSIDELSILARPGTAERPVESLAELAKVHGAEIAPGIRRVDSGIVERLQLAVDHFAKDGRGAKVVVVSGYRPKTSGGSYHFAGRALDFRIDGVKDEELAAFCKTLADTGCGYYPNDVFVHMDVRDPGTGHVAWVGAGLAQISARFAPAAGSSDLKAKRDPIARAQDAARGKDDKTADASEPGAPPSLALARPIDKSDGASGAGPKESNLPALPADGHRHGKKKAHKARRVRHPTAQKPS